MENTIIKDNEQFKKEAEFIDSIANDINKAHNFVNDNESNILKKMVEQGLPKEEVKATKEEKPVEKP